MKPSTPVGFAGDTGRDNEAAGGRGAAGPSLGAGGSGENADAAGQNVKANNTAPMGEDDMFMRTVTASSGSSADDRSRDRIS